VIDVKQSEILDWAMRGVIEEKIQEQDEKKKIELESKLEKLSIMLAVEHQKEKK
jgi:hypothetical protein